MFSFLRAEDWIIIFLLTASLGTVWNYIMLQRDMSRYWKMASPGLSKSEIKKILKSLHELDDVKTYIRKIQELEEFHNKTMNDLDDRIKRTLNNYNTSVKNFHETLKAVYETTEDVNTKQLMDDSTVVLSEAYDLFNDIIQIWPEFFGEEEDKNDTDNTQV